MTILIKPWRQGRLDSLCGAYALINALRLASPLPLSVQEGRSLLALIVRTLDRQRRAGTTIAEGMSTPALRRALKVTGRWLLDVHGLELRARWPYYRAKDAPIASVLSCITDHLTEPNTTVLAAVSGSEDHWTVIRGINRSTIQLFDSAGQHYLMRSNVGGRAAFRKPALSALAGLHGADHRQPPLVNNHSP